MLSTFSLHKSTAFHPFSLSLSWFSLCFFPRSTVTTLCNLSSPLPTQNSVKMTLLDNREGPIQFSPSQKSKSSVTSKTFLASLHRWVQSFGLYVQRGILATLFPGSTGNDWPCCSQAWLSTSQQRDAAYREHLWKHHSHRTRSVWSFWSPINIKHKEKLEDKKKNVAFMLCSHMP